MRFTSETSLDGVREQLFTLDHDTPIPGVLWTPDGATGERPLILLGHGGGRHKQDPDVVEHARRFVAELGCAAVAVDAPNHGERQPDPELDRFAADTEARLAAGADRATVIGEAQAFLAGRVVPEWRAVLTAAQRLPHVGAGPVGYWGLCLGCGLGGPFVAAEPRVRAAVLGLGGAAVPAEVAARIDVPVLFLLQWDDERVPREQGLALFDAIGSTAKTLHANPGRHGEVPAVETDNSVRFFARTLG